jgi:hypothetical protein
MVVGAKISKPRKKRVATRKTLGYFLRALSGIAAWRAKCKALFNGRCAVSNAFRSNSKLIQTHHVKPFAQIRDEVLEELGLELHLLKSDYSAQELEEISKLFVEKHNNIEGIPMLREVHRKFHSLYGLKATKADYLEFKKRWDNGEFK